MTMIYTLYLQYATESDQLGQWVTSDIIPKGKVGRHAQASTGRAIYQAYSR